MCAFYSGSRETRKPCPPKLLLAPEFELLQWTPEQLAFFSSDAVQAEIFGRIGLYVDTWSDFEASVVRNHAAHVRRLRRIDPNIQRLRLERRQQRVPDIDLPHDRSIVAILNVPRGTLTLDADGRRLGDQRYMGGFLPHMRPPAQLMADPLSIGALGAQEGSAFAGGAVANGDPFAGVAESDASSSSRRRPTLPESGDGRTFVLRLHQTFFGECVGDDVRWTSDLYLLFLEVRDGLPERKNFWMFALCSRHLLPTALVHRVAGFLFTVVDRGPSTATATTTAPVSFSGGRSGGGGRHGEWPSLLAEAL